MSVSSADPDRLEAYPGQLASADDELTTLAADVDEACAAFVAGAGSFGGSFDAAAAGTLVRGLRDESQHLSGWVADVGAAFREAGNQGLTGPALDTFIANQVGQPSIAGQQQADDGRQAAEELQAELEALGLDPDDFDASAIADLDPYDPQYQQVYALMAQIGQDMGSEDFAVGFYDAMNADGIQTAVTFIDNTAAAGVTYGYDDFPWGDDVRDQVLLPFVACWAAVSGSVDLAEERAGLLATETNYDQQVLTRLMTGDPAGYDPEWVADGAERILVTGTDLNRSTPADFVVDPAWAYGDPALAVPELVALAALDGNVEAAWSYASRGEAHVDVLLHPPDPPLNVPLGDDDFEAFVRQFETHAGGAIEAAFGEAPYLTVPDPADPDQQVLLVDEQARIDSYNRFMLQVAEGDVPDVIKESVARTLLPHLNDIGNLAADEAFNDVNETDGPFRRSDVVAFFEELGHSTPAAQIVGEQLASWGGAEVQQALIENPDMEAADLEYTLNPVALVASAASDGFDATEDADDNANAGFAAGLKNGASILGRMGPAAIPLLATGPVAPTVTFAATGVGAVVNTVGSLIGDNIAEPVDIGYDAEMVRSELEDALRTSTANYLIEEGIIEDPHPADGEFTSAEWGLALARHFGGSDQSADGDPFLQFAQHVWTDAGSKESPDSW